MAKTLCRFPAAMAYCHAVIEIARQTFGQGDGLPNLGSNAGTSDADPFGAAEQLREARQALDQASRVVADLMDTLEHESQVAPREVNLHKDTGDQARISLEVVAGLLGAKARKAGIPSEAAAALRLACGRVTALKATYETLMACDATEPPVVALRHHLRSVCVPLANTLAADGRRGEVLLEVEPAEVSAEMAFALGLMVNELVTNAFRHGFSPGTAGTVWVQGAYQGGSYKLSIADDGRGLPEDFAANLDNGHGLRMVDLLAMQAGAGLDIHGGPAGTCITLHLPCVMGAPPARPAWSHEAP